MVDMRELQRALGRNFLFGVMASVVLLAGCQSVETTQPGTVGVDRHQRMMVSSEEVNAGAAQAYQQVLAEARKQNALDRDPAQVARVQAILKRLIPATAAFRADAPKWPWEIHVLSSKEVNAWAMPQGKMAVYSGLIERLQPTDDELAAVMGHEIAHALREHSRERASEAMAQQVAVGVVGAVLGAPQIAMDIAPMVLDVTFNLPHSRGQEQEADRIGVELAARAGYDPRAAVSLWEKMQKVAGGGQPPKFLSTHPSHEDRIKDLRAYAERVMPLYQAAKAGGNASTGR
jgi:predicted Zn-dependent protease